MEIYRERMRWRENERGKRDKEIRDIIEKDRERLNIIYIDHNVFKKQVLINCT